MCIQLRAIWWIFLWTFLVYCGYLFSVSACMHILENIVKLPPYSAGASITLLFLFFPVGGWIGDVRCGRYRTIKSSLIIMSVVPIAVGCVSLAYFQHPALLMHTGVKVVAMVILVCFVITGIIGFISFSANVVPFAMDQLRDAPAQQSSLYIYWHVWIFFFVFLITDLVSPVLFKPNGYIVAVPILALIFVSLAACSVVLHKRERWFNTEPCRVNPYKLVYKVTKFACRHKRPIRRSAFTYCEDELPSGLDLGKSKYGGPFTTEEVEDVKVFYEILKVIMSIGPAFYLISNLANGLTLSSQLLHLRPFDSYQMSNLLYYRLLQDITVVATIPLLLLLWTCLKQYHIPVCKIMTRAEIAVILVLLNMLFMLWVNIVSGIKNEYLGCSPQRNGSSTVFSPLQMEAFISVERISAGLCQMLIYTSSFEFICAQSPHSMKGMLIGLGYAIQGVFSQLVLLFQFLFSHWKYSYPSCGLVYHSMNIVIGVLSFILFTWVARRYKYRERDEPSREREFAEEYYSNIQQEPTDDYSA